MLHSTCSHSLDQSPDAAIPRPATSPPSQSTATTHTALPKASHDVALMSLAVQGTTHRIQTAYQRVGGIVSLIRLNPRLLLTCIFAFLGIIAEIEQPGFFPRLKELGIALFAIICASCVIFNVVALERLGEGLQFGFDELWSVVWRWIRDIVSDEERNMDEEEYKGAAEVTMMFNKSGASVFLLDGPKQYRIGTTTQTPLAPVMPQQVPGDIMSQETLLRPHSLLLPLSPVTSPQPHNFPISPYRQEYATPSRPSTERSLHHFATYRQADTDASGLSIQGSNHASGLLGLSPMPPHRTVPTGWKGFSGKGLYKYYQKLEVMSKLPNSRSSRSCGEVSRGVEDTNGKDRGQEGSAVGIEERTERRERGGGNLI